jgi:hypothetical protein
VGPGGLVRLPRGLGLGGGIGGIRGVGRGGGGLVFLVIERFGSGGSEPQIEVEAGFGLTVIGIHGFRFDHYSDRSLTQIYFSLCSDLALWRSVPERSEYAELYRSQGERHRNRG